VGGYEQVVVLNVYILIKLVDNKISNTHKISQKSVSELFPDVFAYPVSRQAMVLSSFYDQNINRTPTNIAHQHIHSHPHPFGHASSPVTSNHTVMPQSTQCGASSLSSSTNNGFNGTPPNTSCNTPITLPPLRRVVKITIAPHIVALAIGCCAALNTVLCLVVPQSITPLMGTQWGVFLYLWLLITMMQLVTHSVYLCTPSAVYGSLLHLFLVTTSAILLPRSLFSRWLWLAPCLCTIIITHQIHLFFLVYTQLPNQWLYAGSGAVLVLLAMTQLLQADTVTDDTLPTCVVWSAVAMYTLYGFALANSRAAVLVDVTVGASPTWQLQD
jgi:hypothetical protein